MYGTRSLQRRHKNCTPAVSEHLRKGDMDGNRHLQHKWQCLFCERQFWTLGKWCRMLKVLPNGMKNNSAKYECSGRCNNCYWGWSARKCFSRVIKLLDCSAKNMILRKKVSFLYWRRYVPHRPGQPNWEYTMWKFQDSTASQNLREINFGHFEALQNCPFDHLSSSKFSIFANFWHFQVWKLISQKIRMAGKLLHFDTAEYSQSKIPN